MINIDFRVVGWDPTRVGQRVNIHVIISGHGSISGLGIVIFIKVVVFLCAEFWPSTTEKCLKRRIFMVLSLILYVLLE